MTGERTGVSFTEELRSTVERCRAELGETGRSLEEIELLLAQTAAEVERLSQREIQLSARLREVESNLEAYPRSEIRDAYRAVHEATLRLFMLRNQMEQLEERRQSLSLYQERLRELLLLAESQLQAVTERERGGDRRTRLLGSTGQLASPLDILAAAERERMLIRRTLEHELVQLMSAVALQVEICLQVERKRADDLRPELLRLRELTSEAVHGLRRTLLELAPSLLEEIGLVETLRRYLRELARISRLERVAVTGPEQDARLAPPLSHLVYRLLQELAVRAARQPGVTELAVELRVESAQLVAVLEAGGPAALDPLPPLDPLVTERLEQLGASLAEEAIAAERWRGTLLVPLT
jgi:two-component system sensor histidine kinase DegS